MATIQHSVPAAPSIAGERLPKRAIVGYGLGDFANNLAFTLGTTFLLYYYTDVAACPLRRSRRCSSSCGCGTP
jgi:hypothetical protein